MFTIFSIATGRAFITTDDDQLARLSVLRGHRVTMECFGQTNDVTFGLTVTGV